MKGMQVFWICSGVLMVETTFRIRCKSRVMAECVCEQADAILLHPDYALIPVIKEIK